MRKFSTAVAPKNRKQVAAIAAKRVSVFGNRAPPRSDFRIFLTPKASDQQIEAQGPIFSFPKAPLSLSSSIDHWKSLLLHHGGVRKSKPDSIDVHQEYKDSRVALKLAKQAEQAIASQFPNLKKEEQEENEEKERKGIDLISDSIIDLETKQNVFQALSNHVKGSSDEIEFPALSKHSTKPDTASFQDIDLFPIDLEHRLAALRAFALKSGIAMHARRPISRDEHYSSTTTTRTRRKIFLNPKQLRSCLASASSPSSLDGSFAMIMDAQKSSPDIRSLLPWSRYSLPDENQEVSAFFLFVENHHHRQSEEEEEDQEEDEEEYEKETDGIWLAPEEILQNFENGKTKIDLATFSIMKELATSNKFHILANIRNSFRRASSKPPVFSSSSSSDSAISKEFFSILEQNKK